MSSSNFWDCRSYEYNNVLKLHCVWVTFCFWSKLTCACLNRNSWSSFFSSILLAFFITGLLCLHKSPLSCLLIRPKCCVYFVKRVICWQLSHLRASFAYWLLILRCCFWEGTRQILSLNVEIQVGKNNVSSLFSFYLSHKLFINIASIFAKMNPLNFVDSRGAHVSLPATIVWPSNKRCFHFWNLTCTCHTIIVLRFRAFPGFVVVVAVVERKVWHNVFDISLPSTSQSSVPSAMTFGNN